MWSFRIAISVALSVSAIASANAQPARTDPNPGPLPLAVINQRPIVEPSPVVADEPERKTSPKADNGVAFRRLQPGPPGNAARPKATATQSRTVSQGNAAAGQGTPWPTAYADAPDPVKAFPVASPPLAPLRLPADATKEQAHLVVPSAVPPLEQVRPAVVQAPGPKASVPTMVAEAEPLPISPGASHWWLLFGTIGGGLAGAAIVWLILRSRTERAEPTSTREPKADQPRRYYSASAPDERRDDPRPRAGEESNQSRDRASAYNNHQDDRASAYATSSHYSREWEKAGAPWRRNRNSAYADDWSRSKESGKPEPHVSQNGTSGHDERWEGAEEWKETAPPWAVSANDALDDVLREMEEVDQRKGRNAASADGAIDDARMSSLEPAEPSAVDQLNPTLPRAAEARQLQAVLFEDLEQEITSLLGRPTGKNSRRKEAEPNGRDAAAAHDTIRDARRRSVTPTEPNPADQFRTTPSRAVKTRQPKADKTLFDSLEQEITSLLGRPTGRNSLWESADQPSRRNAGSAYDAVRDALRESEAPHQPIGYEVASARDAEWAEVDQSSIYDADSPYDAVRDALAEIEEADAPSGDHAASAYDAVRDALEERKQVDEPRRYKWL